MARKSQLTPEEVEDLFSRIDASGVVEPVRTRGGAAKRDDSHEAEDGESGDGSAAQGDSAGKARRKAKRVDPLSDEDPSGSKVASSISRMGIAFIAGVIIFVVGMQVGYGVMRRLNTANLSETVTTETVLNALEGGVEWGNGFTQFPEQVSVQEADERTGVVEVNVLSTDAENELELFSNSQIEAAALATNALLNDNINRVVYNVSAYVDGDGNIVAGEGNEAAPARLIFSFIWTKNRSEASSNINWELRIIGMDEDIAARIQTQVNSVSSLIETPSVDDTDIEAHESELYDSQASKGEEIYMGDDGGTTLRDARNRAQDD